MDVKKRFLKLMNSWQMHSILMKSPHIQCGLFLDMIENRQSKGNDMDNDKLRNLEEKEEELEQAIRQFEQDEEEEEIWIFKELRELDGLQDAWGNTDNVLNQILEEKRNILIKMREDKMLFADEFYKRAAKEKEFINIERMNLEEK